MPPKSETPIRGKTDGRQPTGASWATMDRGSLGARKSETKLRRKGEKAPVQVQQMETDELEYLPGQQHISISSRITSLLWWRPRGLASVLGEQAVLMEPYYSSETVVTLTLNPARLKVNFKGKSHKKNSETKASEYLKELPVQAAKDEKAS
ncbi:hypothetical protein NDU88_006775 [Pleurodeles waltl]|uniref:Uncharacterized protein n=1 Tax=Pleurodeles waltl TaxID=8319 RepID=A0AAV7NUA5_PLEWA|nr:hypothetical protein NDU88_006775 [Pleurodeles waltl]